MATDKIRKYVLPNIPYLFIGWFCLKIGTAYRLSLIHIFFAGRIDLCFLLTASQQVICILDTGLSVYLLSLIHI